MNYIGITPKGRSTIIKDQAFFTLLDGRLPNDSDSIIDLFKQMDSQIRQQIEKITSGALSNAHGDWYEWLLAITAWNFFVNHDNCHLALLLPNVNRFKVGMLYNEELSSLIEDLRQKVLKTSQVRLVTSNPDFVIINGELARQILGHREVIQNFTIDTLAAINTYYKMFIGKCNFDQIVGFTSVKTSFRPDRRLQISHEGSLMKALYTHLQTRKWIIDPAGLRYYAVATKVGTEDRKGLKTVATHSITTVSSLPQAAVDEVYEVNTLQQAQGAFAQMLGV
ncbi:MAG: Cfr10I/Bse634I family restriction endonuclease [Chitinophagales bacterium]|uniref:Cfr10I/Bse634I family restriction endonuclease n=1 Tax=Candidatus Opimibacter skivensis TaxID=2982028 RepID=A0A9D7XNB6_9BACT|nr:Cfr10I/Bse634I family restriction endonuclease [Candidatus Opimibacter skivensis]